MNETLKRVAIDFLDSLDDETVLSLLCEGVACFPADLAQRRAVELQQRCQRGETVREIALSPPFVRCFVEKASAHARRVRRYVPLPAQETRHADD